MCIRDSAGDDIIGEPIPKKTVRTAEEAKPFDPRPYAIALVAVAIALGVGEAIQSWFKIENVDLVFLTAVVGVAVRYGLWPSIFTSVVASLCYNYFFLPPIYTLSLIHILTPRIRSRTRPRCRTSCRSY